MTAERWRVLQLMRDGGLIAPFMYPFCIVLGETGTKSMAITHEQAGELDDAGLLNYSHTAEDNATVSILSPAALALLTEAEA